MLLMRRQIVSGRLRLALGRLRRPYHKSPSRSAGRVRCSSRRVGQRCAAQGDWLRKVYLEMHRLVTVAQSNVDLQSSGVPDTGARQLRRYKSDEQGAADEKEAEAERKEAFAAIQRKRVQFCEFITPNDRVMTRTGLS